MKKTKIALTVLMAVSCSLVCMCTTETGMIQAEPAPAGFPGVPPVAARIGFGFPRLPSLATLAALGPASHRVVMPLQKLVVKLLDVEALISASAARHKVPPAFVKSIVAAESNFDNNAVSRTGAIGLMQLMPETAREYGADPTVPAQNIDAGTRYLRVLMNRYRKQDDSLDRVIAAYNAGPGAVDHYDGIPPYEETRQYVRRVLGLLERFQTSRKHSVSKG